MINRCAYQGQTPLENSLCNHCKLFLETCRPIMSADGLAMYSECGEYLCQGCQRDCVYR